MADIGEQEIIEEDVPFLQLTSKKIKRDNQGFGKHRGGMGYEIAVTAKGTQLWGFATVSSGSKFPAVPGLFGGYGCATYPLAKIKGVNVFDYLRDDPAKWTFDFETLMNDRPFPDARYSTHHMGMGFELVDEGEVYMISQGSRRRVRRRARARARSPSIADVEAGYLSPETARDIYFVVFDEENLAVDVAATEQARAAERDARKARGVPYAEFVENWVTAEPPAHLPYYGSWGPDNTVVHATAWTTHGPARVAGPCRRAAADLPARPEPADHPRPAGAHRRDWRPREMPDLLASLSAAPSGRATPVWFDSLAYCREKLLAGEQVPWASPGELTAFTGKAQGCSAPTRCWSTSPSSTRGGRRSTRRCAQSMRARSRLGYALRTLLADEETRASRGGCAQRSRRGRWLDAGRAVGPVAGALAVGQRRAGRPAGGSARRGPCRHRRHVHRRLPSDLRHRTRRRAPAGRGSDARRPTCRIRTPTGRCSTWPTTTDWPVAHDAESARPGRTVPSPAWLAGSVPQPPDRAGRDRGACARPTSSGPAPTR